jgi:two-component sensor histidine kinase/CHASE3 domain sensor protein
LPEQQRDLPSLQHGGCFLQTPNILMREFAPKISKKRLEAVASTAFVVLMLLFAVNSWFSHITSRNLLDSIVWVDVKHGQLDLVKDLQLELRAAESALRSYVITGNSVKRDEYLKKSSAIMDERFANLLGTAAGNEKMLRELDRIGGLIRRWLDLLNESYLAYERGSGGQNPIHRKGDLVMQQITAAFQDFGSEQHQILHGRILERKTESERLMYAMVASGVLVIAIVVLALTVILRGLYRHREAEKKNHASLEEKENLLKEIHHRVKNNLQIISSLLLLQASKLKDAEAAQIFSECRERIQFMARLHEQLYSSGNLQRIEFGKNLAEIAETLLHSHTPAGCQLTLEKKIEPLELDVDTSQALGLLATELILNSLKHAFTGRKTGSISVELHAGTTNTVVVSDNGVGLPVNFDALQSGRMGMNLAQALARQIRGEAEFTNNPGGGTRVVVGFSLEPALKTTGAGRNS